MSHLSCETTAHSVHPLFHTTQYVSPTQRFFLAADASLQLIQYTSFPSLKICCSSKTDLQTSLDSRWPGKKRKGVVGVELRRFLHRPSSRRQLRCLPSSCCDIPRSIPRWREHPRHVRDMGPRWNPQQIQLSSRSCPSDGCQQI